MTAATVCTSTVDDSADPISAPQSVDDLVRSHMPLVGHLVRDLLGRIPSHVSRDDLLSAGMLALVTSAQNFDPDRGIPFARFAAIRIRGGLTDELRAMDWASRAVRGKARDVDAATVELANSTGRTPSRDEVASAMGVTVAELDAVAADVHRASMLSLQALAPDDGADHLVSSGDGPEGLLVRREQMGYLRDAVAELPERLRIVVTGYFFEQRKMLDIAEELGVTESRVSQLRSEALALLRDGMRSVDDGPRADAHEARGRAGVRQAYCAAVAARSTLASRLAATTLLGETLPAVETELATAL
jgi:RNA polymerase sigma factor for flagellar operon FliA